MPEATPTMRHSFFSPLPASDIQPLSMSIVRSLTFYLDLSPFGSLEEHRHLSHGLLIDTNIPFHSYSTEDMILRRHSNTNKEINYAIILSVYVLWRINCSLRMKSMSTSCSQFMFHCCLADQSGLSLTLDSHLETFNRSLVKY